MKNDIINSVNKFFTETFQQHGATPKGVDWNGKESQYLRFQQLTKIVPTDVKEFTLNDYGCGYGELYNFLKQNRTDSQFKYRGFDISEALIEEAKKIFSEYKNSEFYKIEKDSELIQSDYTIICGVYNKRMSFTDDEWREYVLNSLKAINEKSTKGFSFNMLTKYSDADRMRSDLYYADPCFFFDYCKKNFSRNVALLHDYEAYDFTILVRK